MKDAQELLCLLLKEIREVFWYVLSGIICISFLLTGFIFLITSLPPPGTQVVASSIETTLMQTTTEETTCSPFTVLLSTKATTQTVVVSEPPKLYYDVPLTTEQQEYVITLCDKYGVPIKIVFSIMQHESNFQTSLISDTHDYGIMQINRCNKQWLYETLNITDLLDFNQNVLGGVYILAQTYTKYQSINKALMCYNCGEANAITLWKQGIYITVYTRQIQQTAMAIKEVWLFS